MKATKSIFDKSYLIQAQAIAAGAKEWPQGAPTDVALSKDEATKKFRWVKAAPIPQFEDSTHPELVATELEMQAQADRQANATITSSEKPRFSTCERPTKKVWHIADCMPKATRKDVMAECVRQGIAYGTARTQYQAWFKASQECMRDEIRKPYAKGE